MFYHYFLRFFSLNKFSSLNLLPYEVNNVLLIFDDLLRSRPNIYNKTLRINSGIESGQRRIKEFLFPNPIGSQAIYRLIDVFILFIHAHTHTCIYMTQVELPASFFFFIFVNCLNIFPGILFSMVFRRGGTGLFRSTGFEKWLVHFILSTITRRLCDLDGETIYAR